MNPRPTSVLRALLLLTVALGALQAQAVFACAMMDTVVHDECCCGDHQPADGCTDHHDCESKPDPAGSCCESSVELGLGEDAAGAVLAKPPEPDGDSPPALLVSSTILFIPDPSPVPGVLSHRTPAGAPGSCTWLVTRRLRI